MNALRHQQSCCRGVPLPTLEACEERLLLAGWNITELDWANAQGDMGRYTAIAVAEKDAGSVTKGTVFITCYDDTKMFPESKLTLWSGQVGSSFGRKRLMDTGYAGKFSSIALNSQNVVHISYWNETYNQAKYVGSADEWWSGSSSRALDYSSGQYTALAVDSADYSHVIYYDAANGKLKYVNNVDDGYWGDPVDLVTVGSVSETGTPNVHGLASLALDSTNHPHVSYYDANSQSLKYMQWTGTAWTAPVTLDGGGGAGAIVGVDNTMKLDRQGHPHIAYSDATNKDLKYVQWNGTQWTAPITIDSPGIVGQYASMDMDGAGNPHISYGYTEFPFDPNSQITNPRLKYAYWDGSAWQISVIDTESFGAFEYTACYVDRAGTAYVSYFRDWVNMFGRSFRVAVREGIGAVPNPDLVAEVALPAGQVWLPGDKVTVPVTVTNNGGDPAVGPVTVNLFLSGDTVFDDSAAITPDPLAGAATAAVNLAGGQSRQFQITFTVPADAQPGTSYLIAQVGAGAGIDEAVTKNNVDVSDQTAEVVWQAGSFGTRSNYVLTVEDANGVPTKFALTGGGYAMLTGGGGFTQINIYDTTPASVLTITAPTGTITSIGDIIISGSLKSLTAKTVSLRGNLTVEGTIGTLILNDVQDSHLIDLNSTNTVVDPKLGLTITLDEVSDCLLDTHGIPIKSLNVTNWTGGGMITAPWVASVTVKGDLDADFTLGGKDAKGVALGKLAVGGDLDSVILAKSGSVGSIGSRKWNAGSLDTLSLKSVQMKDEIGDVSLTVSGPIGTLAATRWVSGMVKADYLGSVKTTGAKGTAKLGIPPVAGDLDADITIDGADAAGVSLKSLTVAGDIDAVISMLGAAGSVKAGSWSEGALSAASLKSLAVTGDVGNVVVAVDEAIGSVAARKWDDGSIGAASLKSLKLTGLRGSDTIPPVAGDIGADLDVAYVTAASIAGSLSGAWTCRQIGKLFVGGDVSGASLDLMTVPQEGPSLTSLTVGGWITASTIKTARDIGSVTTGGMDNSSIYAGVSSLALPTSASDFDTANPCSIEKILVKGMKDGGGAWLDSYINSSMAAWNIGAATLANMLQTNTGAEFGITAHSLGKYILMDEGFVHTSGDGYVGSDNPLELAYVAHRIGDYWVRIVGGS